MSGFPPKPKKNSNNGSVLNKGKYRHASALTAVYPLAHQSRDREGAPANQIPVELGDVYQRQLRRMFMCQEVYTTEDCYKSKFHVEHF
jgi:hypothetical protein